MAPSLEDLGAADDRPEVHALLVSLKASLAQLEKLLDECSDHWGYESFSRSSVGGVVEPDEREHLLVVVTTFGVEP